METQNYRGLKQFLITYKSYKIFVGFIIYYQMNKEGSRYKKTRSIIKSEKQLLKVSRRLTNIRHNYIHQITSEIVNRKPMFIVLEDLNVKPELFTEIQKLIITYGLPSLFGFIVIH